MKTKDKVFPVITSNNFFLEQVRKKTSEFAAQLIRDKLFEQANKMIS